MKPRLSIIFAFFFVAACYHPVKVVEPAETPSPELAAIDSLMWHRPNSALSVLMDYMNDGCKDAARHVSTDQTFDHHYAHLLLAELLYKNDYAQTNRTELRQAVAYFDSLFSILNDKPSHRHLIAGTDPLSLTRKDDIVFLTARSHYINGVGYYERDSVVDACAEYLKALEVLEGHFKEKELVGKKAKFMVLTYNRLLDLFSAQFMLDPSIFCCEQSLVFCKIAPTSPFSVSKNLMRLGMYHDGKEEKEQARQYYGQALEALPDTNNLIYRDIVALKALCDYQLGTGLGQTLQVLKHNLALANDDGERLTRYLTIGYIFFEERQYDSALYYLDPVFENNTGGSFRLQAADYLRVIYEKQGDKEKSDEYAWYLANQRKPESQDKSMVSQLEMLFQGYTNRKMEKESAIEKQEAVGKSLKMFISIAVLIGVFIIITIKQRNRKRMNAAQQAHHIEKAALSGRLRQSNQELRELKEQVKPQRISETSKREFQADTFDDEPICRLIIERINKGQFKSQMECTLYKQYALSKEQLLSLRKAADCHFNGFTVRLIKAYPDLTRSDLDYCCLYLLGLTDADVSALMQRAYPTISQRTRKIKTIFGNDVPLESFLRSFAINLSV